MTVSELIAALKSLPESLPVVIMDEEGEGSFDIDEIDQGVVVDGETEIEAVRLFP
ncbi:MAG TPA: hypothetical protein VG735_00010 [Caulobacterales bacterium]|jgi:hypothetical protein|nr:hypothetical protein [Caulobacterales bacterium]